LLQPNLQLKYDEEKDLKNMMENRIQNRNFSYEQSSSAFALTFLSLPISVEKNMFMMVQFAGLILVHTVILGMEVQHSAGMRARNLRVLYGSQLPYKTLTAYV
jgi:hypothetical protein